jgi:hypothetical protein
MLKAIKKLKNILSQNFEKHAKTLKSLGTNAINIYGRFYELLAHKDHIHLWIIP